MPERVLFSMSKKANSARVVIMMAKGKYVTWLTEEGLLKLEGWARDGLANEQIAKNIGVNPDTLYTWIKKYPEISESLKRGKEVVDRQVENALLKRALGYQYNEVTQENIFDEQEGRYELKVTKVVTKEVNPDTTAQIFWLKNRKPQQWRDKQDIEHSGLMTVRQQFEKLSDEELQKIVGEYDVEE